MSLHTHQSVYREKLIEHLLVGALLKHSWLHDGARLEVSYPAVDRSGHDLVLELGGITRHVQLKSSSVTGKTASQSVHIDLAKKVSGCVVWVLFDGYSMDLYSFLFFGSSAGQPLPTMDALPVLKHTKANAAGAKLSRPGLRVVSKSKFAEIDSVGSLYDRLFVPAADTTT